MTLVPRRLRNRHALGIMPCLPWTLMDLGRQCVVVAGLAAGATFPGAQSASYLGAPLRQTYGRGFRRCGFSRVAEWCLATTPYSCVVLAAGWCLSTRRIMRPRSLHLKLMGTAPTAYCLFLRPCVGLRACAVVPRLLAPGTSSRGGPDIVGRSNRCGASMTCLVLRR